MSTYGLKVYGLNDPTNYTLVTPKVTTIVSSGRVTMDDTLISGTPDTYGTVIDLPGTSAIPLANITVFVVPLIHTFKITNIESSFDSGTYIHNTGYMDSNQTYYEHNESTGAMTTWDDVGDLTDGDSDEFDHIVGMFPVAFWDTKGQTTFTEVLLFAATCYLAYDSSASTNKKVYTIGEDDGVAEIDYTVAIKNYNY